MKSVAFLLLFSVAFTVITTTTDVLLSGAKQTGRAIAAAPSPIAGPLYHDACAAYVAETRAALTLGKDPARFAACKRRADHWLSIMERFEP